MLLNIDWISLYKKFFLKVSKAAMLQKGAEYIKQLQAEQYQIKEEIEGFRKKIEFLDNSIRLLFA